MGSIGGWVTSSGIAGAVIRGSATEAQGGRLGGTGAGFNTWWNTPKADVIPGITSGNFIGPGIPTMSPPVWGGVFISEGVNQAAQQAAQQAAAQQAAEQRIVPLLCCH